MVTTRGRPASSLSSDESKFHSPYPARNKTIKKTIKSFLSTPTSTIKTSRGKEKIESHHHHHSSSSGGKWIMKPSIDVTTLTPSSSSSSSSGYKARFEDGGSPDITAHNRAQASPTPANRKEANQSTNVPARFNIHSKTPRSVAHHIQSQSDRRKEYHKEPTEVTEEEENSQQLDFQSPSGLMSGQRIKTPIQRQREQGAAAIRRRRPTRPWTNEENNALKYGMQKYHCNWSSIKNDPSFSNILANRTQVDLKDKARSERKTRERLGFDLGVFRLVSGRGGDGYRHYVN